MKNEAQYKALIYKASKVTQSLKARAIADNDMMLQELSETMQALANLIAAIALEEERKNHYE